MNYWDLKMVNIWLPMNADLSALEVLFADMGDMGFLKILQCPKLQIIGIFIFTDEAVFLALELPAFLFLDMERGKVDGKQSGALKIANPLDTYGIL
jgi:hypothetical protein